MAYNDNNQHKTDFSIGLMKQESVMSLYEPTPLSPTQKSKSPSLSPESPNAKPFVRPTNNALIVDTQLRRNVSYSDLGQQTEAKVLVLYTGGTIGMLRNEKNGKFLCLLNLLNKSFNFSHFDSIVQRTS